MPNTFRFHCSRTPAMTPMSSKKSSEARRSKSPAARQRGLRPILKKTESAIGVEADGKCQRRKGLRVRFNRRNPTASSSVQRVVDDEDPTIAKLFVDQHFVAANSKSAQSARESTRFLTGTGFEGERKLLQAVLERFQKTSRYRSEECRNALLGEKCAGGRLCSYSHNDSEKLQPREHPLFKSVACRLFATDGHCPLGDCCHYLHDEDTEALGFIRRLKLDAIPHLIDVLLHVAGISRPCRRLERDLYLWLDTLIRKSAARALEEVSGSEDNKQMSTRQSLSTQFPFSRSTPDRKSAGAQPKQSQQQQISGYSSDLDESPESKYYGSRDVEDVERELFQKLTLGESALQSASPTANLKHQSESSLVHQMPGQMEHHADSGVEEGSGQSIMHSPNEPEGI